MRVTQIIVAVTAIGGFGDALGGATLTDFRNAKVAGAAVELRGDVAGA